MELFNEFCFTFWNSFVNHIDVIDDFIQKEQLPAAEFRNRENGGHLLFRPVGLLPFVQAIIEIRKRTGVNNNEVFERASKFNFQLSEKPWKYVLWNPNEQTMVMGNQNLTKLLFLYMHGNQVITGTEITQLMNRYSDQIGYEGDDFETLLGEIPIIK